MKAMEGDKRANELYEEVMELITPGPIVFGDFIKSEEYLKYSKNDFI